MFAKGNKIHNRMIHSFYLLIKGLVLFLIIGRKKTPSL